MAAAGVSPKGILKKQQERPKRGSAIAWDEPTIAEHDKERGTRMKIDEPDTPFERGTADGAVDEVLALDEAVVPPESTGAQWDAVDALSEKADAAAAAAAPAEEDDEWADSDDEGEKAAAPAPSSASKAEEAARFQEARRAHYAEEVAKMKEMMRRGAADDKDEDEDEDAE